MQYVLSKNFDANVEAEEAICKAMQAIEEAISDIKCNCHIFGKEYPAAYWSLDELLVYIDKFQIKEE